MTLETRIVSSAAADPAIETDRLTRYFGRRKVVDAVTMVVPRGSVFALLGRNGSGKTTIIRMLLGLLPPTRGGSRVLGHDSRHLPPELRARVGYTSESHQVYPSMTVRECGEYQSRFYTGWNRALFDSAIAHFGLTPAARAGELSRGERAGLSLALTLAPEPELLILDDPALGLDPVARRSLLESMIYVTRGEGRTILFSSHLLDDVERVADHIAVLDRSVLRACCSLETFREQVRQFRLVYMKPSVPPLELPAVPGLLRLRRFPDELHLTLAQPGGRDADAVRALGADLIEEIPVAFDEALIGYLGDRDRASFSGSAAAADPPESIVLEQSR